MADLTGQRAGFIKAGLLDITAYLYEGNLTVGSSRRPGGLSVKTAIAANEIEAGDIVEFFDDAAITAEAARMTPVVRPLTGNGACYAAIVAEVFPARVSPSSNQTDLGAMLAGDYLRTARIIPFGGVGQIQYAVTIPENGGGADSISIGTPGEIAYDHVTGKLVFESSTDAEWVPLLHMAGSTTVPVTGPMIFGIGFKKFTKVGA
jgi:hypothetical protein